jgi:hypothetical protein
MRRAHTSAVARARSAYFRPQLFANAVPSSGFDFKIFGNCELPHIGAAKYRQAQCDVEDAKMLAWIIAVVLAIGLIWSVATMSNLVPVVDSGSAAISRAAE